MPPLHVHRLMVLNPMARVNPDGAIPTRSHGVKSAVWTIVEGVLSVTHAMTIAMTTHTLG